MKNHSIEVACFTLAEAQIASKKMIDRIELCDRYDLGGITPSIDLFQKVKSISPLPIAVMIRPRSGNFDYLPEEIETMLNSIRAFQNEGATHFVFGCLTPENEIDLNSLSKLLKDSGDAEITFHRAFDEVKDPENEIKKLIQLGIKRVLTSGGKPCALDGIRSLMLLQDHYSNDIEILVGGGVKPQNITPLWNAGLRNFHFSMVTDSNLDESKVDSLIQSLTRFSKESSSP